MATTPRFALRYPSLSDAPHGPLQVQQLAQDVEGQLARALPCLSTARPASPPLGMLIFETDTSLLLIWDGDSWNTIVAPATGGGGGTTAHAQFSASSAQSVPNAADTTCAFGTTDASSALVTRAARGAGHQFTLGATGLWSITATVRYASAAVTGERYSGLHTGTGGGDPLAGQGQSPPSGNPVTNNFGVTKQFASGAVVFVNLYQGTGAARSLELGSLGGWVRINFALVG